MGLAEKLLDFCTSLEQRLAAIESSVASAGNVPPDNSPSIENTPRVRIITSNHAADSDLFRTPRELTGFRQRFEMARPGIVIPMLNCAVMHRNIVQGPVGFATRIGMRQAATLPELEARSFSYIDHALGEGNIASQDDHYGRAIAFAPVEASGIVDISVWGGSHSSAAPDTDGLAEINWHATSAPDYNILMTWVIEGGQLG